MSKNFDYVEVLYHAWIESIVESPKDDTEKALAEISRQIEAAEEAAGIDLSPLLAAYEDAARKTAFRAGLSAGLQMCK